MCLFGSSRRPYWEEEVVFANRKRPHRKTRITETTVIRDPRPAPVQYIQAPPPRTPTPPPPPKVVEMTKKETFITPAPAPTPPPPAPRVELVSVEEDAPSIISSVRKSKSRRSSGSGSGSRRGSAREEVYIERERERLRMPHAPSPVQREEYDTFRYVPGVEPRRERARSITYETSPRITGRVTERERVVVEDEGRRREYYRRP